MKSLFEIFKPEEKKGFKMRINMIKTKHKAIFLNFLAIAIIFLELLHFANLNLAVGISFIIIATAIVGTIIAEIREGIRNLKEFAKAMSEIIDND